MFLVALGVPISWEKVRLGCAVDWIGWRFNLLHLEACLPEDKRLKLLTLLEPLLLPNRRVARKAVEHCIGLLLWFCAGAFWLRPWLQALYKLLYKPRCVFRSLSSQQFGLLQGAVNHKLVVDSGLAEADICKGWTLHSVGNCSVASKEDVPFQSPRLKHGCVDCVFFDYSSSLVQSSKTSAWSAQLFFNAVRGQLAIPLRQLGGGSTPCAADAFADASLIGLGGWWALPGKTISKESVAWFSIQLNAGELPAWLRAPKMQQHIAAFMALGQLLLLLGRLQGQKKPSGFLLSLWQLCDNAAVAACSRKLLSMKEPLCFILQAIGFYCSINGVSLLSQHCAGARNEWADALSRGRTVGFDAAHECKFGVNAVLSRPWQHTGTP